MREIRLHGKYHQRSMLVDDNIYAEMVGLSRWFGWTKDGITIYARSEKHLKYSFFHRHAAFLYGILNSLDDLRQIDHINHNGLDNRKINLRAVTAKENQQNQLKRKDNTSGYKGVWRAKSGKGWEAGIRGNGKRYIGSFPNKIEAAKAYDAIARELGYLESSLNFPLAVSNGGR